MFREETFNAAENVQRDPFSSGGIVLGDMGAQCDEVVDTFGRPGERHTLFGKGRSLRVSQEATQSFTRLPEIGRDTEHRYGNEGRNRRLVD